MMRQNVLPVARPQAGSQRHGRVFRFRADAPRGSGELAMVDAVLPVVTSTAQILARLAQLTVAPAKARDRADDQEQPRESEHDDERDWAGGNELRGFAQLLSEEAEQPREEVEHGRHAENLSEMAVAHG